MMNFLIRLINRLLKSTYQVPIPPQPPGTTVTIPTRAKPGVKAAAAGAWVLIAVGFVAGFEGFADRVYVDKVGTDHPLTYCFGETRADGPLPPLSKVFTKAECTASLEDKLVRVYAPAIDKCIHVALPPNRKAALVSAAYNLGPDAVCKGAIARNINAGNVAAGCKALLAYDHAQGKKLAGLTRRRKAEYNLCIRDD